MKSKQYYQLNLYIQKVKEDFAILYVETINGNIDINTLEDNDTDLDATVEMFAYACTEGNALEYLD